MHHWGVDWGAVQGRDEGGQGVGGGFRGASTITMQTGKNLYLWTARSYVRKVLEVPLAYLLSAFWPKQRVMEVYLNIAQWGPGIFGAEAASQHYFHKSAAELTRSGGAAARGDAAQPAPPQSRQTKSKNGEDCPCGREEDADSRPALDLRIAAECKGEAAQFGPLASAGLSPYKGGHEKRRDVLAIISKVRPWLFRKEKPRA